ncbi:5-carboxymethyl-2-hydroxymuconate Delta-isomerase [Chryseobacterium proteolyticum]|uniref:5-carboxymethyl-2-hydroxymuconate Delta-isomerase n=1 Tax=Chryseobacterium proteolyticum TaxID=118127 RepID=UPI003983941A
MPHFIIDCSENILDQKSPGEIMNAVYETAENSGLFAKGDIKVRLTPFKYYKMDDGKESFIHIFGNIMGGRTIEQKASLSRQIIERLNLMFPDIPILSINIQEFEAATYCNKSLINPENMNKDRHFPGH